MALDLKQLVGPKHTALVSSEIQRGVIGDLSALPELAKQGREILANIARLAEAARGRGAQVIHCIAKRRADDKGMNRNARGALALHGLSPFQGTELDFVNAGYQAVLPIDAVAGTPRSYVEQVFEHTGTWRRW